VSGDSADEVELVAVQPVTAAATAATTSVAIRSPKGCDRVGTGLS
jgi:hypothetical protein